jgi:beta-hydroxylase
MDAATATAATALPKGEGPGWGLALAVAALVVAVVAMILASSEANRRQGRVRAPARDYYWPNWRQHLIMPYNRWVSWNTEGGDAPFPALETHFPRHRLLGDAWEAIRDEAMALYRRGQAGLIRGDDFFTRIADDGWRRFYLKWYGPLGDDARRLCPRTCALLDQLPEVRLAMFSFLDPGSVIRPHTGPSKGAKRYHLGLACPPEAAITVDGTPYSWREGEGVLFDDTYYHEVANRSATEVRAVLFCDVETRMKTPRAQRANRWLLDRFGPFTTRTNDATEARAKEGGRAEGFGGGGLGGAFARGWAAPGAGH